MNKYVGRCSRAWVESALQLYMCNAVSSRQRSLYLTVFIVVNVLFKRELVSHAQTHWGSLSRAYHGKNEPMSPFPSIAIPFASL